LRHPFPGNNSDLIRAIGAALAEKPRYLDEILPIFVESKSSARLLLHQVRGSLFSVEETRRTMRVEPASAGAVESHLRSEFSRGHGCVEFLAFHSFKLKLLALPAVK